MSGLTYVGKGAFVAGVPARDLTAEEVVQLGSDVIDDLIAKGLYKKAEGGRQNAESRKQIAEDKPTVKKESE